MDRFSQYPQRDADFLKHRIEHPYIYRRTQRLFDFILQDQPRTVLEVGCGDGFALYYINPPKYVGLDTSLARLRLTSDRNRDHSFIQGDGTCLPLRSEEFDLVFCSGTLHHLSKRGIFLMIQEMGRVCKTGGCVAIIEPNVYNPSAFLTGMFLRLERGIFHCKPKVFLKYLEMAGMGENIKLEYVGVFSPIGLLSHIFSKSNFVKTPWFIKLWEGTDRIVNKMVPERFWTSMVIIARKGSPGYGSEMRR